MQPSKILFFLLIIFFFLPHNLQASASNDINNLNTSPPETSGQSVILMDAGSGRVLFEKNSHERLSPASLTKIMTALLVVENGDLDKNVIASESAASTPEATIYLEQGETLTRMDLLYAAMLHSANDACIALAESLSGTEANFVQRMNQRAAELGMKDTHYNNPHGLESSGHYSSAYDLALLARKALSDPIFADVVSTRQKIIPWAGHDEDRVLYNINRLLNRYEGAIGVKTGYTKEAGNCVVGAERKGDMVLIAVSMNSPTVYDDLERMLDFGYSNYQLVPWGIGDNISSTVKVLNGETDTVLLRPDNKLMVAAAPAEIPYLSCSIVPQAQISAPVEKGQVLGVCELSLQGKQIASVDLLADRSVKKKISRFSIFGAWLGMLISKWYLLLLGSALAFLLVYKTKNQITFEECLKRILRRLLRKKIARIRSRGM